MPLSLSTAAILRSIALPSRLRSLSFPRSGQKFARLRSAAPDSVSISVMCRRRVGFSSVAGFTGDGWRAEMRSGRASFAGGERKWADGGGERGGQREGRIREEMGTLHHEYVSKKAGAEMDGGYKQPLQQHQGGSSRLLTLPTVLTIGRVAAVPLLVFFFHMNGSWSTTATTGIFLVAAVTDWLDGYLARKMRLGTTFGAFLDPVADKLMVAATLVLLCTEPLDVAWLGEVPWILTVPSIAIIGREITMSAVREWAASQNSKVLEAVAVNNVGKWKTATQMTALTTLLITRNPSLTELGLLVFAGVFLLYVSAGLALWSLAVYMRKIWRFLLI